MGRPTCSCRVAFLGPALIIGPAVPRVFPRPLPDLISDRGDSLCYGWYSTAAPVSTRTGGGALIPMAARDTKRCSRAAIRPNLPHTCRSQHPSGSARRVGSVAREDVPIRQPPISSSSIFSTLCRCVTAVEHRRAERYGCTGCGKVAEVVAARPVQPGIR